MRSVALLESSELEALVDELRSVNAALWRIEDNIRDCERNRDFGPQFIKLARDVYRTNDRRGVVKRKIDDLLDSELAEEKF